MFGRIFLVLFLAACAEESQFAMTECPDGECAARKAQALLQSHVSSVASAEIAQEPGEFVPANQPGGDYVPATRPANVPDMAENDVQPDVPGNFVPANQPGGDYIPANGPATQGNYVPATTQAPYVAPATAAPATTQAPYVAPTTAAPATTQAPYVAPTTAAPATTQAPYVAPTTAAPATTAAPEEPAGKCTPTCSWQCVSPECERTCKPACQQPQCETRCKTEDTTGCSMNCSQPQCYTICPRNACKKTENCPMCTTHCDEAMCKLDCPQTQPCENLCEAPVCEWQCDIPEACPQPDCRLDCQEPKDCMNGGISGAPLPALGDGEIKVHSFSSPVNMREPTGATPTTAPSTPLYRPGMIETTSDVMLNVTVFTRDRSYRAVLPLRQ